MRAFFKILEKNRIPFRRAPLREEQSARCGRCAHILPDETLTFCPRCGAPFSKVPPTTSFHALSDRAHTVLVQRYRVRLALTTGFVFAAFWLLLASFSYLQTESRLAKLRPVRPLDIYLKEDPAYPALDSETQVSTIAVALQSFENHFGIRISEVTLHRDRLPTVIEKKFPDLWSDRRRSSLSFWESQVYPMLAPEWDDVSGEALPVLLTNVPIVNDLGRDTPLETAHLNAFGLVSGLGHPSLSIISTYRMLREEKVLFGKAVNNPAELKRLEARFMGEYVFAHEMGHALLALPDFVRHEQGPSHIGLRGPASLADQTPDYASCLMHTDEGGGYQAWTAIRARSLEAPRRRSCAEYFSVLAGFRFRTQALDALHRGDRRSAEKFYSLALKVYAPPNKTWLRGQWEQENLLFMSVFKRWWSGFFMIQSS